MTTNAILSRICGANAAASIAIAGLGQASGRKYPGRPATEAIRELVEAERKAAAEEQGG